MPIPIYQVDAFTSEPFRGNPAAVCLLTEKMPDDWMQNVAAEMNLSETAFVLPISNQEFDLRWMTPTVEVDLCGHATIASAHVLYATGRVSRTQEIRFLSRSGPLIATSVDGMIQLDFPAVPPTLVADPPKVIGEALEVPTRYVGKNAFDYLVEIESERTLRNLKPDFARIKSLGGRGLVVTARAEQGSTFDFVSRGFFPNAGIDEDPVTGSAHCMLGPYWQPILNKSEMTAYQASKRGGVVKLRVNGDRVILAGEAVTVLAGELR